MTTTLVLLLGFFATFVMLGAAVRALNRWSCRPREG